MRTSVIDSRNCASGKDCTSLKRCLLPSKKGHACPVLGQRIEGKKAVQNTPRNTRQHASDILWSGKQDVVLTFKPGHFRRVYSICEGLWSWQLQGSPCQWRMWIVSAIPRNRRLVIAMAWRQKGYLYINDNKVTKSNKNSTPWTEALNANICFGWGS